MVQHQQRGIPLQNHLKDSCQTLKMLWQNNEEVLQSQMSYVLLHPTSSPNSELVAFHVKRIGLAGCQKKGDIAKSGVSSRLQCLIKMRLYTIHRIKLIN